MSAGYAMSNSKNLKIESVNSQQKRRAILLSFLMIMLVQTAYFTGSPYEAARVSEDPMETHNGANSQRHLNVTSLSVGA